MHDKRLQEVPHVNITVCSGYNFIFIESLFAWPISTLMNAASLCAGWKCHMLIKIINLHSEKIRGQAMLSTCTWQMHNMQPRHWWADCWTVFSARVRPPNIQIYADCMTVGRRVLYSVSLGITMWTVSPNVHPTPWTSSEGISQPAHSTSVNIATQH